LYSTSHSASNVLEWNGCGVVKYYVTGVLAQQTKQYFSFYIKSITPVSSLQNIRTKISMTLTTATSITL